MRETEKRNQEETVSHMELRREILVRESQHSQKENKSHLKD
jgi:cell division septum initiation protein DivIVA